MATVETGTVTVTINGREATVPKGLSLVEAAAETGIEIPVFCYEPRLGAAVGACRMCLVEIDGMPKLQTACTTPVADGMVVHSRSDRAREGQDAVLEF
ncbi:MAG TPA: 2Fe-2S iron-sulfur cluster-binding protein, partial [Gaiellales bacterium]|nr:2Fe-2S iron-sulfur cluster-binding protein [Gaiellales bacterium]